MLDEYLIRYKMLPLSKRLALCAVVGILPALLHYSDESSVVEEEFADAEARELEAAEKLRRAEYQLKNMQKTEEQLAFTTDQLKKAESRLPDNILIDEVLRNIARAAKDLSVTVKWFEPGAEVIKGDNYKFSEVPFKISVSAPEYSQICEWVDAVAGAKTKMFLKTWSMSRGLSSPSPDALRPETAAGAQTPSMANEASGREARKNLRVVFDGQFVMYKMLSATQAAAAAPAEEGKKPGEKDPNGGAAKPNEDAAAKDPKSAQILPPPSSSDDGNGGAA